MRSSHQAQDLLWFSRGGLSPSLSSKAPRTFLLDIRDAPPRLGLHALGSMQRLHSFCVSSLKAQGFVWDLVKKGFFSLSLF